MRYLSFGLLAFFLAFPVHAEEITGTLTTGQGSKPATTSVSSGQSNTEVVTGGGNAGSGTNQIQTGQPSNAREQIPLARVAQDAIPSASVSAEQQIATVSDPVAAAGSAASEEETSEPPAPVSQENVPSGETQLAGSPASVSDNPENLAAADTAVPVHTFDYLWPSALVAALVLGGLAGFLVGKRRH